MSTKTSIAQGRTCSSLFGNAIGCLATVLGLIHGHITLLQEDIHIINSLGIGNANAGANALKVLIFLHQMGQFSKEFLGIIHQFSIRSPALQGADKLITANLTYNINLKDN